MNESTKFLGVMIDSKLNFNNHIDMITNKIKSGIFALRNLREFLPKKKLIEVYHALIGSHLRYGILAWGMTTNQNTDRRKSCREKFSDIGIMTFPSLYAHHASVFIHGKIHSGELRVNKDLHGYNTRKCNDIYIEYKSKKKTMNTIYSNGIRVYNRLPEEMKKLEVTALKSKCKEYYINQAAYSFKEILD